MKICSLCETEIPEGAPYYGLENEDDVPTPIYLHRECGYQYVLDKRQICENANALARKWREEQSI